MTSENGNSSLRTENSVFLAHGSPFYLLCVIFSLLHFSVDGPRGGGGHGPSAPMVNKPMCTKIMLTLWRLMSRPKS